MSQSEIDRYSPASCEVGTQSTQPAVDWNQVYSTASRLEHANSKSIGNVFNDVDQYLAYDQTGSATRQQFLSEVCNVLQQDRMTGQVLDNFSHSQFQDEQGNNVNMYDFLRRGHKRMSTQDLADDTADLNANSRSMEAQLSQLMIDPNRQTDIENSHYEGAFLGLGGPVSGIDNKRLDKYAKNEQKTREAENGLSLLGIDSAGDVHSPAFMQLSHGKPFITSDDVKQEIINGSIYGDWTSDQLQTLRFMRDNFGKMSKSGVDQSNPDSKCITTDSLLKYARKQHANVTVADQYNPQD